MPRLPPEAEADVAEMVRQQLAREQLSTERRDTVDHPPHYTFGKIEVLDAIEDWSLGYHAGNVVKYIARARHKGSELEDLRKARTYLNRLIKLKEGGQDASRSE